MLRPGLAWTAGALLLGWAALASGGPAKAAADPNERNARCLALIAHAEAASEGEAGMLAVMRVVQNRAADGRFAKDACAVALEPGQFQPVGERPALKRALAAAEPPLPAGAGLAQALELARRHQAGLTGPDATGGALFFLNPELSDPAHCGWFRGLGRTAAIGRHVFLAEAGPGRPAIGQGLRCAGKARLAKRPVARPSDLEETDLPTPVPVGFLTPGRISPLLLRQAPGTVYRIMNIRARIRERAELPPIGRHR